MPSPWQPVREGAQAPPPILAVATDITVFAGRCERGPVEQPTAVNDPDDFRRRFGSTAWPGSHLPAAVALFFANGGRRAVILRYGEAAPLTAEDYLPDRAGVPPLLRPLEGTHEVNLLCLPPCRPADELPAGAVAAAQDWCAARGVFLLVDPPLHWTSAAAMAEGQGALAPPSPDAAVYAPRLLVQGEPAALVPCGAVAGVFARSDAQQGVWRSPAGVEAELRGIDGLALRLGARDQDLPSRAGVNILRSLPHSLGERPVVVGARTRADRPEGRYVPVRRTLLMIERSLAQGLAWTAFEPNGEPLWQRVRLSVEQFLEGLWRAGGLQGNKPEQAFFVRCDRTTMTQDDLDAGRLLCMVGVAPLRPAEFVLLRIGLWTAQRTLH